MEIKDSHSISRKVIGIIGAALAISLFLTNTHLIYGLISTVFPISSSGVVASADLGVYWENQCFNTVTSINWGSLSPGDSKSVIVFVKNTGTTALTLSLSTNEWNPSGAGTHISLAWDYADVEIQPNSVRAVTLTLTISEIIDGITNYDFNIHITGTT